MSDANFRQGVGRLETPASCGYRTGMSSHGVIGRKLDAIYGVSHETPGEIRRLLSKLEGKVVSRRAR